MLYGLSTIKILGIKGYYLYGLGLKMLVYLSYMCYKLQVIRVHDFDILGVIWVKVYMG